MADLPIPEAPPEIAVQELAPPMVDGVPPAPVAELPPPPPEPVDPVVAALPDRVAGSAVLHLPFAAGAAEPDAAEAGILEDVALRLRAHPRERLELRAYASGDPEDPGVARRLSLERALVVREALVASGIAQERLIVFAHGMNVPDGPADRVDLEFR